MSKKGDITDKLVLTILSTLIPLIIFGLYKNGYTLYKKELITFINMTKPLIIILMGLCGTILGTLIREKKNKRNIKDVLNNNKLLIIESLIICMLLPIKSSPIIVFIILFTMGLWFYKLDINKVALFYIFIKLINNIIGLGNFENIYESNTILYYNTLDKFLGFTKGGICSTNTLLIIFSLIFLSNNKLYKKEIAITSIVSYISLVILLCIFKNNYTNILPTIFGYNTLFTFVYVSPSLTSSSYTDKGKILFGLINGILTFIIGLFIPYSAACISTFITSCMRKKIDRIFIKNNITKYIKK